MKISEHLTLAECIRSDAAKRNGIDNNPSAEITNNIIVWAANVFEPIRNHFGVPIYLSSMFRCRKLNEAIGGTLGSQHEKGEAGDIDQDGSDHGVTNKDVFEYIRKNLKFDQLIWEFGDENNPAWVHVSFNAEEGAKQRGEVLKARKIKGRTFYSKY